MYPALVPGSERPRQLTLGWWDRFQTADGWLASTARFVVAAAIIGCVVWAGRSTGSGTLFVVNGLGRPVVVTVGAEQVQVQPRGHVELDVSAGSTAIRATTTDGQMIEELDVDVDGALGGYVYNVAGAALLIEWRNGTSRSFVTPHWQETAASRMFDAASEVGSVRRDTTVLFNAGVTHPWQLSSAENTEATALALAHVRWDPPHSLYLAAWLDHLEGHPDLAALIKARLAADPEEVVALRAEQDLGPRGEVCARHRARASAETSDSGWQYLAVRCVEDHPAQREMFLQLVERWPEDGWILMAGGHAALDLGDYERAIGWLASARSRVPENRDQIVERLARAQQLHRGAPVPLGPLADDSPRLARLATIGDSSGEQGSPALDLLHRLYRGEFADAATLRSVGGPMVLFLAGVSDGAPRELVSQALDLPPDQLGPIMALFGHALARREGRDPAPYQARFTNGLEGDAAPVAAFFTALDRDPTAAEAALASASFEVRLSVLAAGAIALGDKAPARWRQTAKLGLFPTERPYFK
jgi:hypothetical protein